MQKGLAEINVEYEIFAHYAQLQGKHKKQVGLLSVCTRMYLLNGIVVLCSENN